MCVTQCLIDLDESFTIFAKTMMKASVFTALSKDKSVKISIDFYLQQQYITLGPGFLNRIYFSRSAEADLAISVINAENKNENLRKAAWNEIISKSDKVAHPIFRKAVYFLE